MNEQLHNTAILLFSRSASAEAAAKSIVFQKNKAEKTTAFVIKHARRTARLSGLPVFVVSEKQQRGATFGEKLGNAFDDIFQKGFQNVIAVGNDCLDLSAADLQKSAAELNEKAAAVVGKATDGGVYLLGLRRDVFAFSDFQKINWQTDGVFSELTQLFDNQNITTVFLSEKPDFDAPGEFLSAVKKANLRVRRAIFHLLNDLISVPKSYVSVVVRPAFLLSSALRAPPIF